MKLENKVAIVTAAGRGIGRGIALCLAEAGANLVVNSFQKETTAKVAGEVEALGRQALPISGDIAQISTISQVIDLTLDTFGRIDILVNNVGGGPPTPGASDDSLLGRLETEWDEMYQQNLKAPMMMCQAVAPHLIKQKSGKIVNIASGAGRNTYASKTSPISYQAMKAGLIRYTQSLADKLGPHNINVNGVCPGYVYSVTWEKSARRMVETREEYKGLDPKEWFDRLNEGKYPELAPLTPLMREQTVEDIGQAVIFLVSEEGKNITGQTLNVDGGRHKN
jgi:NAD(P)-dependent dehydrogenase (short-subunit alcohol dehydrogenase family)|tara:strand:+ start:446 stop:1285 length:840 start_codon:yes stop_codon:yes gene_type:complete